MPGVDTALTRGPMLVLTEDPVMPVKPFEQFRLPDRPTKIAEQLRGITHGKRVRNVHEVVPRGRLRLKLVDTRLLVSYPLLLLLHGALADHHGLRQDGHVVIRVARGDVAAGPADLGKHLMRDPALELLRSRQFGREHQRVKTRFVNQPTSALS